MYQAFDRYFWNDRWIKKKKKEREKDGRRKREGEKKERKSLEQSIFKFTKVK